MRIADNLFDLRRARRRKVTLLGGVAAVPYTPQADFDTFGGLWWDADDLATGAVSNWVEKVLGQGWGQGTGSAQPTKGANGVTFDGGDNLVRGNPNGNGTKIIKSVTAPDGLGMPSGSTGKGVTVTGLCRVPGTDQFWIANHGDTSAAHDQTGSFVPSLIRVSYAGGTLTKLQEIDLSALVPGIKSVQGVTWDSSDGTLWFASATAAGLLKVYHVTTAGVLLGDTITPSFAPNGIAYDAANDALWISQFYTAGNTNIEKRSCATGAVIIAAAATSIVEQDHLFFDNTTRTLLVSYGANGSNGMIKVFRDTGTGLIALGDMRTPAALDCIEGIVWEGKKLYAMNDAFYHGGASGLNQFIELDCVPPVATVVDIACTVIVPATTSTDCIIEFGAPLNGNGFGLYPTSTTGMNVIANTGVSGTGEQGLAAGTGMPALTSKRVIYARLDVVNDLATIWCDGTQIATGSLAAVGPGIPTPAAARMGTSSDGRLVTATVQDMMVFCGGAQRQKVEGWVARKRSLLANLPADHPYKNVAP